jgi:hypothetical protein
MTEQEFRNQLEKVLNAVQDQGLIKPGLLLTEHNSIHIISGAMAIFVRTNQVPTVSEMARYINDLGDIEVVNAATGRPGFLQYHHGVQDAAATAAAVPDPRLSIPHRDKWPTIDSKLKWIAHTRNVKIPVPHQAAWNELGAYLQAHPELRGSATEASKIKPEGVPIDDQSAIRGFSEKTQDAVLNEPVREGHVVVKRNIPDHVAACLAQIEAMKSLGSAQTGMGARERLAKVKSRIRNEVLEQARVLSPEKLMEFTTRAVHDAESSSIR